MVYTVVYEIQYVGDGVNANFLIDNVIVNHLYDRIVLGDFLNDYRINND